VDTVAERLNQNCRLVFAEEEEDSPASGSDLELGSNGGHGIPAPSKALRLAPLAVAGRPSQRQCLGFVEGVGDSPGLVRKSSGKPGETHWRSGVPSLTEALDCMPLAIARRQTCGQKEDRDEEEEDNNNTPENEVYRRGRIPAPPEMLDFMPMPLPVSRRPTQGQKRRIVLEEEEEEEDNAPDTRSETHRGVPAPSEALGVTPLAIARRPTQGPKGRVVVMEEEEEEEEEDNDGAPEPAAATTESLEPPASGSELDAHMHGCTVAHLEATRTRPIQGIGDEESLLREHQEGHWEGHGKAWAGAPAWAVDESTRSSVPPPSELEGESEGGEWDRASSDCGAGWPEPELGGDLQDGLEDGDKKAKLTVKMILQALQSGQNLAELIPLTPSDKELDLWRDFERLRCASVVLATQSKDPSLDALLRTRLTGMLGVLNLYLDPALHYTWREASLVVAKMQGWGEKHSRKLRKWILDFIQIGEDIVDVVSSSELQQIFSWSGITKPGISERTGRRWLSKLDWQYGRTQKGMYIDGHECKDVVEYRKAFVERWEEYQKRFHLYDNNGDPLPPPTAPKGYFPPGGRFRLILVTHDESTFYQNDLQKSQWAHKSDKPTPQPKGDGQSVMVSDFLTADWGHLRDGDESVTSF